MRQLPLILYVLLFVFIMACSSNDEKKPYQEEKIVQLEEWQPYENGWIRNVCNESLKK